MTAPLAFRLALDAGCTVGESTVWDAKGAALLFCDIPRGLVHEWRPADGARRSWRFDEPVGSFGLCLTGQLVVALRRSVVLLSRADGRVVRHRPTSRSPTAIASTTARSARTDAFGWVAWTTGPRRRPPVPCTA